MSASPPSSGGVALLDALNILSGVRSPNTLDSATRKHLVIEAMQRAYRDRAVYLGDPDFVTMPMAQLIEQGLCRRTAHRASARTRPCRATCCPASRQRPVGQDTTHFSVLDAAGQPRRGNDLHQPVLRRTATWFPKTGVLLNDTMDDFSIKPGTPNAFGLVGNAENAIAANKRPLSSMTPSFIETPEGPDDHRHARAAATSSAW